MGTGITPPSIDHNRHPEIDAFSRMTKFLQHAIHCKRNHDENLSRAYFRELIAEVTPFAGPTPAMHNKDVSDFNSTAKETTS